MQMPSLMPLLLRMVASIFLGWVLFLGRYCFVGVWLVQAFFLSYSGSYHAGLKTWSRNFVGYYRKAFSYICWLDDDFPVPEWMMQLMTKLGKPLA